MYEGEKGSLVDHATGCGVRRCTNIYTRPLIKESENKYCIRVDYTGYYRLCSLVDLNMKSKEGK